MNNIVSYTAIFSSGYFVIANGKSTVSQLSSSSAALVAKTYPNYKLGKAFSLSENGTISGYVVIIDANNIRYALEFDASGAFVHAITIH